MEALKPWNHCNMQGKGWCLHILLLSKEIDKPSFCKIYVLNIGNFICFLEAASFPHKNIKKQTEQSLLGLYLTHASAGSSPGQVHNSEYI